MVLRRIDNSAWTESYIPGMYVPPFGCPLWTDVVQSRQRRETTMLAFLFSPA